MIYCGILKQTPSTITTITHPNGIELEFHVPVTKQQLWFSSDSTNRYMIYVHYELDKELLWQFQTLNPDKILLPGLTKVNNYFIADYLPLEWHKCIPNPQEFADVFSAKLRPFNLLKQFDVEKTYLNARSFLHFCSRLGYRFVLDYYVIENFRGDNDGNVFWFDPIIDI